MKKSELGDVLRLISLGFTKNQIRKKLNISKSNLSNILYKLEELGCIIRKGKYEIEILSSSLIHPRVTRIQVHKKLNKRGHAFNFKIIFPKEENLKSKPLVKQFLGNKKVKILKFGSIRYVYKKNTIWINKESLTIYTNTSYYSDNALHSKFRALKELDLLIQYLKSKFQLTGIYGIEVFREHYGLIYNKFAEWLLERNRKLKVENKNNKLILWVDDSMEDDIGLKEFESNDPLRINNADNLFASHERTNWKVTPEFILESFGGLLKTQTMNADNIIKHQKVLDEMLITLKDIRKSLSLKSENKDI